MEREPREPFAELHVNETALLFSFPQARSLGNAIIQRNGMELYGMAAQEEQT